MSKVWKIIWLWVIGFVSFAGWRMGLAQELQTPSQKAKEAIEKFSQTPAVVGKKLQDLTDTARAKVQEALGEKREPDGKSESRNLGLAQQKTESSPTARVTPKGTRDPFRPATLQTRTTSHPREHLSPLERIEWGQINLVGIVWDAKEPRALVEVPEQGDKSRGYIVKLGTPIGTNEGKVKAITRNEMIVEEFFTDFYGAQKKREVSKRLPTEQ